MRGKGNRKIEVFFSHLPHVLPLLHETTPQTHSQKRIRTLTGECHAFRPTTCTVTYFIIMAWFWGNNCESLGLLQKRLASLHAARAGQWRDILNVLLHACILVLWLLLICTKKIPLNIAPYISHSKWNGSSLCTYYQVIDGRMSMTRELKILNFFALHPVVTKLARIRTHIRSFSTF